MCCRSAPEFGQSEQGRNALLRKTQSQPHTQKGKDKKQKVKKSASKSDANLSNNSQNSKNVRSFPSPLPNISSIGTAEDTTGGKESQGLDRKTSCPTSPTAKDGDKPKLENKKTAPGALGAAGGGSPKPKRNIFEGLKNTLRPKSKSQDNSSSNSASLQTSNSAAVEGRRDHQVYANMHSMPELNVDGEVRALSPETSSGANSHDRKLSGGNMMTSSATTETETTSAVSH